ncbi:MAG: TIGR04283 family arsenosugar biosynthesis glycosyltransferase [Arenicellales bacterium]|nr:TIGR04283 family arsenosugar biosynthesis glycosyltransferase [Arenicellales bacterium]
MISIIIPVRNERRALPETLRAVLNQVGEYEIIVVDGGSSDDTVQIANQYARVTTVVASTGRASQMNAGAQLARGEWLLFLHADTQLPEGALQLVEDIGSDQNNKAGGFCHRFSNSNWGLRLISWINNLRCKRTRVFYGDQAPFVRRSLFEELGGFPSEPFLEDVLFMEKLLEVTKPVCLPVYVTTDSRRFIQHGIWRSFSRVFLILSCHKLGLKIPARKFFAEVR